MISASQNLRYTRQHEWIRNEDGVGIVGISAHAQKAIGDITFVELPAVGREVRAGEEIAVIESTKAASEVYAPASGKLVAVNTDLEDDPALINADPCGKGWLVKIQLDEPALIEELMSEESYAQYTGTASRPVSAPTDG